MEIKTNLNYKNEKGNDCTLIGAKVNLFTTFRREPAISIKHKNLGVHGVTFFKIWDSMSIANIVALCEKNVQEYFDNLKFCYSSVGAE